MIFRGGYGCRLDDRNHASDLNLMWDVSGADLTFAERETDKSIDISQWKDLGHDLHSIISDPKCADPQNADFGLAGDSPAFDLGFVPIDTTNVGPRKRN